MTENEKNIEIQRLKKQLQTVREEMVLTLDAVMFRLDRLSDNTEAASGRVTDWNKEVESWRSA